MPGDDPLVHRLLDHKWMPQIVAVLPAGPHRFSELCKAADLLGQLDDELRAAGSQAGDDDVDVFDGECDVADTRSVGRRVPVVFLV